jgi:hypothetical protein
VVCQIGVSASGWPLVQISPTECGVSKLMCDRVGPGPQGAVAP